MQKVVCWSLYARPPLRFVTRHPLSPNVVLSFEKQRQIYFEISFYTFDSNIRNIEVQKARVTTMEPTFLGSVNKIVEIGKGKNEMKL